MQEPVLLDLCREHGMSSATSYAWKSKYGGLVRETLWMFEALIIHAFANDLMNVKMESRSNPKSPASEVSPPGAVATKEPSPLSRNPAWLIGRSGSTSRSPLARRACVRCGRSCGSRRRRSPAADGCAPSLDQESSSRIPAGPYVSHGRHSMKHGGGSFRRRHGYRKRGERREGQCSQQGRASGLRPRSGVSRV